MSDAQQTYSELFKLAEQSDEVDTIVKESATWQQVLPWLAGGGALAAGIPLAYNAGERSAEEAASRGRPLTFGAGALAGATAIPLLKKLRSATGLGLSGDAMYDQYSEF